MVCLLSQTKEHAWQNADFHALTYCEYHRVRPWELSFSQVFYEGFSLTADFLPWRLKRNFKPRTKRCTNHKKGSPSDSINTIDEQRNTGPKMKRWSGSHFSGPKERKLKNSTQIYTQTGNAESQLKVSTPWKHTTEQARTSQVHPVASDNLWPRSWEISVLVWTLGNLWEKHKRSV